jgi:peptidyl-prolyl cis-trans isomerase D
MLQFFRSFFKSKVGIAVILAFLGLLAFSMASSDVLNTAVTGGVSGDSQVAVVGDRQIDANDLAARATNQLDTLRRDNPTLSIESFIANNGLADVLDAMVSGSAISDLAQTFGFRVSTRLVDSEIVSAAGSMRRLDGTFDTDAFRATLRQQGISEEAYRDGLMTELFARQLIGPVQLAPTMPQSIARRYAQSQAENRSGSIAVLPASAFAPRGNPTDAQLQAFRTANAADYTQPERRVIRYAVFGEQAFGNIAPPTEAQIAARYERDAAQYAAQESRRFTQLVAPTQAAAQAIVAEVRAGTALEASARSKGLSTADIALTTQADLASTASDAVAAAGFGAASGAITAPTQGSLGWYVLRVDQVERRAARTLPQARAEIAAALTLELRREALNDATARIEEEFSEGRSLSEVAQELGVEIASTRPLTAAGLVYGSQETANALLMPVLSVAFEMEEGEPQLAEAVPGSSFIIYDVADITRSAVAPLAEIRTQLVADWRQDQGLKAAGEAAARVEARVAAGSTLAAALQAEDVTVPAPQPLRLSSAQLQSRTQVTRPEILFFMMAQGTTKVLESAQGDVWYVVQLDTISAPDMAADNPLVASTSAQLGNTVGQEYIAQFVAAARAAVEVAINQSAVDAVAAQLTGRNAQ